MTIKKDAHGNAVQAARPYSVQNLTMIGASVPSAAFTKAQLSDVHGGFTTSMDSGFANESVPTTHIRVVCTADCWLAFGAAPTASVAGVGCILLPASSVEYFWVYPGEVVAGFAAAGTLNIAELVN